MLRVRPCRLRAWQRSGSCLGGCGVPAGLDRVAPVVDEGQRLIPRHVDRLDDAAADGGEGVAAGTEDLHLVVVGRVASAVPVVGADLLGRGAAGAEGEGIEPPQV